MNMENRKNWVFSQHLVCGGEVRVYLIEVGTFEGIMVAIFFHHGEFHDWRSTKEINDLVGNAYFILDV
jgi:hypothetical protein